MKGLKEFGNRILSIIKGIGKILRDLILGLLGLIIGTAIIFLMGLGVWLISGYPGVEKYFKALNGEK